MKTYNFRNLTIRVIPADRFLVVEEAGSSHNDTFALDADGWEMRESTLTDASPGDPHNDLWSDKDFVAWAERWAEKLAPRVEEDAP